ncbi:MAG: hypothetical protein ABGZ36_19775, partial [Actinomycetota bacterium]
MKAMAQTAYGDPEVLNLTDVDDPTPGPDTVVIDVKAAGVNPVDWQLVHFKTCEAVAHCPDDLSKAQVWPGWRFRNVPAFTWTSTEVTQRGRLLRVTYTLDRNGQNLGLID